MEKLPFNIETDLEKIGLSKPIKITCMVTGSASDNYHVKNKDGDFLVKILKYLLDKDRLLYNSIMISGEKFCPTFLLKKEFYPFTVLVFKWIEGENIFLEKLSDTSFKNFIFSYQTFLSTINKKIKEMVYPAVSLEDRLKQIRYFPFFVNKQISEIKKDLSYKPNLKIIHGDLNYKNLIFRNGKLESFLDFQEFSWGCPTEDLIRLLITNAEQHNFFRVNYTLRLLKIMLENTKFSKEDWIYGLNVFILIRYKRKLKRKALKGMFSIIRCNFLYQKIRKEIFLFFAK